MYSRSTIFLYVLCTVISLAVAGKTYYCSGSWKGTPFCKFEVGDEDTKIVIASPHAGRLRPDVIPQRDAGCLMKNGRCRWEHNCGKKDFEKCAARYKMDDNTARVARKIVDYIDEFTGIRPHFVKNNLNRGRFDGNREIHEATFENPYALKAFGDYHGLIQNASQHIKGRGVFIDMHGQAHIEGWIEMGYLVKARKLDEGELDPNYCSIRGLYKNSNDYSLEQIIRGNKSLGYYLQKAGYKSIPSPAHPAPGQGGQYYSGNFNIRQHGSLWNSRIDGVQIELPKHLRTDDIIPKIAKALAKAIVKWIGVHYGKDDK